MNLNNSQLSPEFQSSTQILRSGPKRMKTTEIRNNLFGTMIENEPKREEITDIVLYKSIQLIPLILSEIQDYQSGSLHFYIVCKSNDEDQRLISFYVDSCQFSINNGMSEFDKSFFERPDMKFLECDSKFCNEAKPFGFLLGVLNETENKPKLHYVYKFRMNLKQDHFEIKMTAISSICDDHLKQSKRWEVVVEDHFIYQGYYNQLNTNFSAPQLVLSFVTEFKPNSTLQFTVPKFSIDKNTKSTPELTWTTRLSNLTKPNYYCPFCLKFNESQDFLINHLNDCHSLLKFEKTKLVKMLTSIISSNKTLNLQFNPSEFDNLTRIIKLKLQSQMLVSEGVDPETYSVESLEDSYQTSDPLSNPGTNSEPILGNPDSTNETDLNQLTKLKERVYINTRTGQPKLFDDLDVDSDGEEIPDWVVKSSEELIDSFVDVSPATKTSMKQWNLYIATKYNQKKIFSKKHYAFYLEKFVKLNCEKYIKDGMRSCLCKLILTFLNSKIIDFQKCSQLIKIVNDKKNELRVKGEIGSDM